MNSEVTSFSEERAKGYDERIRQHIPGYGVLHGLSETILASELPAQSSVLVAGIGTGMEVLEWAPKHSGWKFVGVDPSEAMLAVAQQKINAASLKERIQLVHGPVAQVPEQPFDAATLLLVLHFLPDNGAKEEIFNVMAARLKPAAPILVATLFGDPESTRYKRMQALTKAWALSQGMTQAKAEELFDPARKDLFVVPEDRLKNLFRYAGFIDVQRVYQAFSYGLWMARMPRSTPSKP